MPRHFKENRKIGGARAASSMVISAMVFARRLDMHRLFVAIRPPRRIREILLGSMGGISGARWQSDDQLHLTLRFIGAVDRHRAGDVHAALGAIRQAQFDVALNGIGAFEKRGIPDAVWAGVTPHAPLKSLHKKVDAALGRVAIEPEQRAYLPHITLARLKPSSGSIGNLLEDAGGLTSPLFTVDAFALLESDLTSDRAVYTVIERYPLN
jgi:2'-5' RNA ligase